MATTKIVLYKLRKLKDDKHPISLRFTIGTSQKYIRLGFSCYENEWDFNSSRLRRNYKDSQIRKEHNYILKKYELLAEKILKENDDLTFEQFKSKFRGTLKKVTVKNFFENRISILIKTNRIGYADIHKSTLSALNKFKRTNSLCFPDISNTFLQRFEEHLTAEGCTGNGISVYMRTLRTVYNEAIKEGYAKNEHYPFKSRITPNGYNISKIEKKTSKRAISKEDVLKIKEFKTLKSNLINARNFFMFSYYTMGMNFADLAYLKTENIIGDRLYYCRMKNGRNYTVKLLPQAMEIIKYYNNSDSDYIFPILDNKIHETAFQKKTRIKTALKKFNKDLKEIAIQLKISSKITSYVARHSWATVLRKGGIAISVISQGLGHEDEKTTQIYLDSFENEVLDKANESII